ncbi:dipeptidase [Stieleria varia]|nr:dipeptidase [Stieleria varia]
MSVSELLDTLQSDQQRLLDDLIQWLRIPSVSSDSRHIDDTQKACQWIADKLSGAGLSVEILPTEGHPMVLAETPPVPGAPTVVVYGHYDVQPAEPLNQWTTPPFEPEVRDGNLYARGATDDKGQLLTHVQSVCRWLETGRPLPLQIKFLIEGEEEIGSANLERLLPELRERLACDCVVISDSSQYADGQPAITYGLRGIATYELQVDGPSQDLHSGSFGGAVMNPAIALTQMLSSLIDSEGRIQIPGYYDDVRDLTDTERRQWQDLPQDDDAFAKAIGVDELAGELGFSTNERRWARPTFDINGLTSGHQGEGGKTIIPATASAKFSFRLVPDQDPEKVTAGLRKHLDQHTPTGVRWSLKCGHGAVGMLANTDSPFMKAASDAIEQAFGVSPVLIREGGSIPIVTRFQEVLGCDCLLLGWGLSDDNAHSPNEKFRVDDYFRGIQASAILWDEIGKLNANT